MKSTIVDFSRSSFDRALRRGENGGGRRRGFAGRVLEALETRALLHTTGTIQFDEHEEVFGIADPQTFVVTEGLVPDGRVTIESVANPANPAAPLSWSNPASWVVVKDGVPVVNAGPGVANTVVPKAGDNVLVTRGTTVAIGWDEANAGKKDAIPANAHTIRVDGTLAFTATVNTKLLVDTIVVEPSGTYQMGTQAHPIQNGVKADVVFTCGAIDTTWDPYEFSRGLLTHGAVSIYGQQVTSDVAAMPNDPSGATALAPATKSITLSSTPTNWNVGDRLIITGDTVTANNGTSQDEQVAITGLSKDSRGNTVVTFTDPSNPKYKGLAYEHDAPAGSSIYIADVTRNAVFESQNPTVVAQAGHLMFMHNGNVNLFGVGVYGLGRTDKRNRIDDPNPVDDPANSDPEVLTDDVIDMVHSDRLTLIPTLNAYGQLVPRLVSGQAVPILDAGGAPVKVPVLDKSGKVVKDASGAIQYQPAFQYDQQTEEAAGIPLGRVLVPVNDAAGNPIPLLDAKGNTVLTLDAKGNAIPVRDSYGKVVTYADGTPQYQIQYRLQVARTGTNPRGRYAVHFHRTGTDPGSPQATMIDGAAVDSPGWGIVNHSSNVDVEQNVVFNALGAAYVTEAGDEVGQFVNNIAIHSQGAGGGIEDRKEINDFGQLGDGFWLQGGNVSLIGNVATGMHHSGYVFFPVGLVQKGLPDPTKPPTPTQISVNSLSDSIKKLLDPTWDLAKDPKITDDPNYTGPAMLDVGDVPLRQFSGNVASADGDGFESWFSQLSVAIKLSTKTTITTLGPTVVDHFTVWNTSGNGIFTPYTKNITFRDVSLTSNLNVFKPQSPSAAFGTGFARNDVTAGVTYDHVKVQGYATGINVAVNGNNLILAGTFNNVTNILITTANSSRVININDVPGSQAPGDKVTFLDTLSPGALNNRTQYDIYLNADFTPRLQDITTLFTKDLIQMGTAMYNGKQLYYLQQAADYVPFPLNDPTIPGYIPNELRVDSNGQPMTNAKLFAAYGLAIGGTYAPADATRSNMKINALIGTPSTYLPDLQLLSRKYTIFNDPNDPMFSKAAAYKLSYKYYDPATSKYLTVPASVATVKALHAGWNVIPVVINGVKRALLVYGDNTPPAFTLAANTPTTLNQADIDNGASLVIQGKIGDDSFGSKDFRQSFKLNDPKVFTYSTDPATGIKTGTLTFKVTDNAGNTYAISLIFEVTDLATLAKDIGRKTLPTIKVSVTLVALLAADGITA